MMPCRLLIDPPQSGAWNMAVDEALLEEAAERGAATLRFYRWEKPTLSLGYFQPYDDRESHAGSLEAEVVRRLSGGGALVHDREVTYSLTLPAGHEMARQSTALYETVHVGLIAALASQGVRASLHRDQPPGTWLIKASPESFLCFSRRTEFDVILASGKFGEPPAKIAGSAQRRRRGALLQHGAVLLARSAAARELAGIEDLTGAAVDPGLLITRLAEMLADALDLELFSEPLSPEVVARIGNLVRETHAADAWIRRR